MSDFGDGMGDRGRGDSGRDRALWRPGPPPAPAKPGGAIDSRGNPWSLAYRPRADVAGALVSGACAVHCALVPFAAVLLPSVVARAWESELVHNLFAIAVAVTSLLAFVPGWLKHGESRIWGWVGSGVAMIVLARASGAEGVGMGVEAICTSCGGVLLLVAHRLNHTLAYWSDRL